MIENYNEYEKMYRAEKKFWWYRILHSLVLKALGNHFKDKKIHIIDGGCGTGGLMHILAQNGYSNVTGFDISTHALKFSKERGLNVFFGDLRNVYHFFSENTIDAFICNDSLYFLSDKKRKKFAEDVYEILKPKGVIILNLPSFKTFRGTHDISVGIKNRFRKKDIPLIFDQNKYEILETRYWPFLLSPLIFILRMTQRLKIKFGAGSHQNSDIKVPPAFINNFLHAIIAMENKIMKNKPWGSS
ncbi:MAG TPA: class I SAM-dependent methyltransferase, partial [Cytophagaceae bacterium]|nr:class I SAM-dependent methyltransferase [Cytophagaceae bacterium]